MHNQGTTVGQSNTGRPPHNGQVGHSITGLSNLSKRGAQGAELADYTDGQTRSDTSVITSM